MLAEARAAHEPCEEELKSWEELTHIVVFALMAVPVSIAIKNLLACCRAKTVAGMTNLRQAR